MLEGENLKSQPHVPYLRGEAVALCLSWPLGVEGAAGPLSNFCSLASPVASTMGVTVPGQPVLKHSLHMSLTSSLCGEAFVSAPLSLSKTISHDCLTCIFCEGWFFLPLVTFSINSVQ